MYSILKDQIVVKETIFKNGFKKELLKQHLPIHPLCWRHHLQNIYPKATYQSTVYIRTASATVIVPVIKSGAVIMPDTKIVTGATVTF